MHNSAYVQKYQQQQFQHAVQPSNVDLILKQRNWKHSNGRINAGTKDNPKLALTVSPYADDFETQIEDGVKPLVMLLREKGYLTTSSCEGHRWRDCARVVLAFGNQDECNRFIDWFTALNIPHATCVERENIANVSSRVRGARLVHTQEDINHTQTAQWFNVFFYRQYENYYFCEIKLWDFVDGVDPLAMWKNYKIWSFKKAYKDDIMSNLLESLRCYDDYSI